jgi:hypothetical protein
MDGAIITQGGFTSTGATTIIQIPQGANWMRVINYTNANAQGNDSVRFTWQLGMAAGTGIREFKSAGGDGLSMLALVNPAGFTLVATSGNPLSTPVAVTASSNVVRPIVSTASTVGLSAGDMVKLTSMTGQEDLSGYTFTVDTVVANTSFRIASALATAPGAAATAGFWTKVKFDPLFYPRHRFIVNVTQAASAVVTLSIPSGYKVGQEVRFIIPDARFGMVQLNNLVGIITAVNDAVATQTITVNIDTTAFTAFTFPTAAQAATAFSKAMVVPNGIDTATALAASANILSDATTNTGLIGMSLGGGSDAPAGLAGDVMYWIAGNSFSVTNT